MKKFIDKKMNELNEEWKEFFEQNKSQWKSEFDSSTFDFFKELSFLDFSYEYYKYQRDGEGHDSDSHFEYCAHFMLNMESVCKGKKVQTKLECLEAEIADSNHELVIGGDVELDTYGGWGRLEDGRDISEIYQLKEDDETIKDILYEFELLEKMEQIGEEIQKEEEKNLEKKIKEKLGKNVFRVNKQLGYVEITFKNGMVLKGDMEIIFSK